MNFSRRALFAAVASVPLMTAGLTMTGCASWGERREQNARINESFQISDGSIVWGRYNVYLRGVNNEIIPVRETLRHDHHHRKMYGAVSVDHGTTDDEVAFTIIRGRGKSADRWTVYASAEDASKIVAQFMINGDLYREHRAYKDVEDAIRAAGGNMPSQNSSAPAPGR